MLHYEQAVSVRAITWWMLKLLENGWFYWT